MSGFAGLSPTKNQRQEESISSGQSRSLCRENVAPVVGLAALTAKVSVGVPSGGYGYELTKALSNRIVTHYCASNSHH